MTATEIITIIGVTAVLIPFVGFFTAKVVGYGYRRGVQIFEQRFNQKGTDRHGQQTGKTS